MITTRVRDKKQNQIHHIDLQHCNKMIQARQTRNVKHHVKYLNHSHIMKDMLTTCCANYKQLLALKSRNEK